MSLADDNKLEPCECCDRTALSVCRAKVLADSASSIKNMLRPANYKPTRKDMPVFSGVMQYFPDALLQVALHSKRGNDKHNPGEPLHWAKDKSKDQADCVARHLIDIGPNWDAIDPETGSYHATALAWRALALLQTVLERGKEKKDA